MQSEAAIFYRLRRSQLLVFLDNQELTTRDTVIPHTTGQSGFLGLSHFRCLHCGGVSSQKQRQNPLETALHTRRMVCDPRFIGSAYTEYIWSLLIIVFVSFAVAYSEGAVLVHFDCWRSSQLL